MTPTHLRDIPSRTEVVSAYKIRGKRRVTDWGRVEHQSVGGESLLSTCSTCFSWVLVLSHLFFFLLMIIVVVVITITFIIILQVLVLEDHKVRTLEIKINWIAS